MKPTLRWAVIFLTIVLITVPVAAIFSLADPRILERALGALMLLSALWSLFALAKERDSTKVLALTMAGGGAALMGIPKIVAPGSSIGDWLFAAGTLLIVVGSVIYRTRVPLA